MLGFYKDAGLTLPIASFTPKWISVPLKGGTKTTSVWLGDAYTSLLSVGVGSSDTTIFLTQTDEFTTTGVVQIDQEKISYTGVTSTSITGCTRGANSTVAVGHIVGATVYPSVTYTSSGNILIFVVGMTAGPTRLSLALPGGTFGPPGVPLLLSTNTIQSGIAGGTQINLQLTMPSGLEIEYTNLALSIKPMTRLGDIATGFASITAQPNGIIYVQQRDQGLQQRLRLLPLNQKVNANLPGFTWGQYRWRDNTTENAQAVVPTRWDIDTSLIQQDFIGGVGSIGETNDIEPIDLEEQQSSIYLRAGRGQYFTGTKRYYLPSDNFNLEFLSCYPGLPFTYQLLNPPREQTPVFVGTWSLDNQSFYEYNLNVRYMIPSTFDPNSSQPQFMVDRKTGILTINAAAQIKQTTILLGVLSGGLNEYFDIPIYPIDKIVHLYVGNPTISIPGYVFNREQGNVTFPLAPGTTRGQPLFAVVDSAIAVLYEYDVSSTTQVQNTYIPDEQNYLKDTRLLTPDLNPAFAGLSSGYVYLQHRELKPVGITLSADKPQIPIPATLSSIIGLIAYGPVYYNGDYSLLTATAVGSLPNEVIPGAQLQVVAGGLNQVTGQPLQNYPFRGLINGLDPNTNTIIVTTGGDGIANLVFQPSPNFGFYIPTVDPWVTGSTSFSASAATWTAGTATLTLTAPVSDKLAVGTSVRLAGFTASTWNGDYAIATNKAFTLTGNAQIVAGTATVGVSAITGRVINSGDVIKIAGATSSGLNGTATVLSASLSVGVWTVTFSTGATAFSATPQTTGTLLDTSQILISTTTLATPSVLGTVAPLDTLLLPGPVPISQIWAGPPNNDGWLEFMYAVLSNDPLFGLSGGSPTAGQIPFVTNGTVNGVETITHASWAANVATFTLAAAPTNLIVGQNVNITGCTTTGLNGIQNVLSVFQVSTTWFITTPTTVSGTSSEAETAQFNYSNFRSNGVLSGWNEAIASWSPNHIYQVGDMVIDTNNLIEEVVAISGSGTSGVVAPTWATLFGAKTIDNAGGNQVTWSNCGKVGLSSSVPLHAYDKNGHDYMSGLYSLTGTAQVIAGTPNIATVHVADISGGSINPGDSITISGATSTSLNSTWTVATASLSVGIWTVTFNAPVTPFAATPQTSGILSDTLFNGNVVKLVFSTGIVNPSQGFVQAYMFQFLEREIIQLKVVGTNIFSNSIMLQMQTPQQILNNPYLVLSTDQTVLPYYTASSQTSRFNINRLGTTPVVVTTPT